MPDRGFLSDILQRVALGRLGRRMSAKDRDLAGLGHTLISDQGEASGLAAAADFLDGYEALGSEDRLAFFNAIADQFSVDEDALTKAIAGWAQGDGSAARAIHEAAEPRSQELIRRLNRLPGATARLVRMRADLLALKKGSDTEHLKGLDQDFKHLFSSWFNRGFLEIRRIDWSTSAAILEKIIAYEAVHEIKGWDDLRQRVADPDRRLFAFFHPAMPSDPLIFVEVALTKAIPNAIAPILDQGRSRVAPERANTAVFYSISNCQAGLRGISFGNFLIKQVVVELGRELPGLKTYVTLSPVPGLRKWAASEEADLATWLNDAERTALSEAKSDLPPSELLRRLAAHYLTTARRSSGTAYDPVAHFHLGNGAELHAVHAEADLSTRGRDSAWGVMVNYLYDGNRIEENHQAYATDQKIAQSGEVRKLAQTASKRKP
jgi:malonyl-CoA decarboxylase